MADILGNFDSLISIKPELTESLVQTQTESDDSPEKELADKNREDEGPKDASPARKSMGRRMSSWTRKKLTRTEKPSEDVAATNLEEADAIRAEKKRRDAENDKERRENGVMALMAKKKAGKAGSGAGRQRGMSHLYSEVDHSNNSTPREQRELLTDSPSAIPSFLLQQVHLDNDDKVAADPAPVAVDGSIAPATPATPPTPLTPSPTGTGTPTNEVETFVNDPPETALDTAAMAIKHLEGVIKGMRNALMLGKESSRVNTQDAYSCAADDDNAELAGTVLSLEALKGLFVANMAADPYKTSMDLVNMKTALSANGGDVNLPVPPAKPTESRSSSSRSTRRMSSVPMHQMGESSKASSEMYGNTILGSRIQVQDDEGGWHDGIICGYKEDERKHEVIFDDGIKIDVDIGAQPIRLED